MIPWFPIAFIVVVKVERKSCSPMTTPHQEHLYLSDGWSPYCTYGQKRCMYCVPSRRISKVKIPQLNFYVWRLRLCMQAIMWASCSHVSQRTQVMYSKMRPRETRLPARDNKNGSSCHGPDRDGPPNILKHCHRFARARDHVASARQMTNNCRRLPYSLASRIGTP